MLQLTKSHFQRNSFSGLFFRVHLTMNFQNNAWNFNPFLRVVLFCSTLLITVWTSLQLHYSHRAANAKEQVLDSLCLKFSSQQKNTTEKLMIVIDWRKIGKLQLFVLPPFMRSKGIDNLQEKVHGNAVEPKLYIIFTATYICFISWNDSLLCTDTITEKIPIGNQRNQA